ncbi:MAG: PstS family phosphate ABC transporter substrate-binding protein, partial [Armatimonadota bacterium]
MKKFILAFVMIALLSSVAFAQSGSIKISGSTTVLPLSQIWAEEYMKKYPNVSISVSGGGSGTGISMLLNGTVQIGNASREAKSSEIAKAREKNQKLVATRLAKDGLAIVVHPKNTVKELTLAQIASIYLGKVTDWNKVGGSGGKIIPIGRDSSSGTYGFFQDAVLGGKRYAKEMRGMPSNAAVASAVAQSEGAIGYVGIAYAHDYEKKGKLKIVAVSRAAGADAR